MTESWVTLTMFDALPAAEIARGRLQVEGIACALADRSLLHLGIVADGIELQVPAAQFPLILKNRTAIVKELKKNYSDVLLDLEARDES